MISLLHTTRRVSLVQPPRRDDIVIWFPINQNKIRHCANTSLYILLTWNLLKVNKEFCEGHGPINGLDGGFDLFFIFWVLLFLYQIQLFEFYFFIFFQLINFFFVKLLLDYLKILREQILRVGRRIHFCVIFRFVTNCKGILMKSFKSQGAMAFRPSSVSDRAVHGLGRVGFGPNPDLTHWHQVEGRTETDRQKNQLVRFRVLVSVGRAGSVAGIKKGIEI